jgi:hypothetical protein
MQVTIANNEQMAAQFEGLNWLVKGGWLHERLVKNFRTLVGAGEAELFFSELDESKSMWDGTIVVKFAKKPDVVKVVNGLVSWAKADEVSMENTKTLRLWWD